MKYFLLAVTATFLFSCKQEEIKTEEVKPILPKATFTQSLEHEEWGSMHTIREIDGAHTGKRISVMDSTNLYSVGLNKPVKSISAEKFDSVAFTYWIYFKSPKATAKSVVSIDDITGKNIFWAGNIVNEKTKELNKWVEIKDGFKLPSSINPEHFIKLYLWNTSKEEILIDDLNVTFY
ncbi:MAG: hypothetical protein JNL24_13490 [Bacteroidia bacterium]|nr:hypothetical protein [Bacteroidia bacterium]